MLDTALSGVVRCLLLPLPLLPLRTPTAATATSLLSKALVLHPLLFLLLAPYVCCCLLVASGTSGTND